MSCLRSDETIATALNRSLDLHSRRNLDAFITADGRTVSYRQFEQLLDKKVARCGRLGLVGGARVGLILNKTVDSLAIFFALVLSGATPGFIDPRSNRELVAEQYAALGMEAIVCEPDRRSHLAPDIGNLLTPSDFEGGVASEAVLVGEPVASDPGLVLFTSGSTGRPKAVVLSHRAVLEHALGVMERTELDETDLLLHLMPIFHTNGLNNQILVPLLAGSTVFLAEKFNAENAVITMRWWQPSIVTGVPTMFLRMLPFVKPGDSFDRLRMLRCGSAPIKDEQVKEVESAFSAPVILSYGMSEATCTSTMNPPSSPKLGSVGTALSGQSVRIAPPGGTSPLPPNEVGEVLIGGCAVMTGYIGTSAPSPIDNGWLRTGDTGHIDESGYLFITGRLKDTIVRGGENISPGSIERVIIRHPAVRDCCVVAGAHHDLGEVPIAFVSLSRDSSPLTVVELEDWSRQNLSRNQVPEDIIVLESLPVTELGKIDRSRLVDLAARRVQ